MAIETLMSLGRIAGHEPMPIPAKTRAMGNFPYDAAGRGRRAAAWNTTRLGVNTLLYSHGEEIRSRSRDAVRNSAWAAAAIDSFTANAIGRGIRVIPQHPDAAVRESILAAWTRWSKESDTEYDPANPASGQTDWNGQQMILCREIMEAGEAFIRFRVRPRREKLTVPLQLQLIESEQLPLYQFSTSVNIPEGNVVRSGIEFRPDGRRAAYHMWRAHPGETMFYPAEGLQIDRIPANQILHCYKPIRAGQMRGQPWLTPVLAKLYELDQYADAEIVRKKTASMITGFIQQVNADTGIFPVDSAQPAPSAPSDLGSAVAKIEPGSFPILEPGENVVFADQKDSGDFEAFIRTCLRAFAAGAGLTYEQISGDLTQVNYSSIRAGLLEFRRKCEQFQYGVFVYQVCHPVFRVWLKEAVIAGAVSLPGYVDDPAPFENVQWVTPGWPWVDPLKDMQAAQIAVRSGFDSRTRIVSEQGGDAQAVDAQQAIDNARADGFGLVYDIDPRKVMLRGAKDDAIPDKQVTVDRNASASEREEMVQ